MKFYLTLFLIFFTNTINALPLNLLKLPKGFSIEIYAYPVPNARSMTLGSKDIVFVSSLSAGNVYAIVSDANKSNNRRLYTIASGLDMPNGVAFYQGSLYVAESKRILRFDDIEHHLSDPPNPIVVTTTLPQNQIDHRWRS